MGNYQLPPLPPRGRGRAWATAARAIRAGLAGIAAYKLRAGLTMLGVIIGVCGVLTISAFGQVASGLAAESLAQFGTTLVTISAAPVAGAPALPLTEQDVQAVRQLPHVLAASPMRMGEEQAGAGNQTWHTAVSGVYPEMQAVLNLSTSAGAFFTAQDEQSGAPVAIIGRSMATQLFGGRSPIGQQVRLGNVDFRVAGVLQWEVNNGGVNFHDTVYVPFTTAQRLYGPAATLRRFSLRVDHTSNVSSVGAAAANVVEQDHHLTAGSRQGFEMTDYDQLLAQSNRANQTIEAGMTLIVAVGLLMGGVGIVNVMFSAVQQRRREIGLRMAVGAQRDDVLLQFLVEATTLSVVGGLLGLLAGFVLTVTVVHTILPAHLPPNSSLGTAWLPSPGASALALLGSLPIGITFGAFPARRAAGLDPVDALRQA
ncbi:MAG: ABC transporter permease [Chloroflexota bacterium]